MNPNMFNSLSDDLILNIFTKLIDDPRHWSRAACACTKFSSLIRTVCWKNKCQLLIPAVVSDLVPPSAAPPGGWSALFKLAVCCPGLVHAGVLLEHSDFGLERELGPDESFHVSNGPNSISKISNGSSSNSVENSECGWSLYDDLYLDTVYNDISKSNVEVVEVTENAKNDVENDENVVVCKKRKVCSSGSSRLNKAHLASELWNFSREQGNKLLASRFRGDCLYVCDWPGCVHTEEKRNYMLFRGVFKNFKMSRVWRTIKDGNKSKIDLNCAYCSSNDVWDMHSAFCLRPAYGFQCFMMTVSQLLGLMFVRMGMFLVRGRIGRCILEGVGVF